MNIYEKINAVMNSIQYLGKDGKIDFNKTSYKAISEEKVTTMVRRELIKHKLVVYPTEQTYERVGNLTRVNTKYIMVNAEKPSEYIIIASSGEGADTQDKGVGKAMTYAFKYMLLRTFAIPTGEDPDKISSEELTQKFAEEKLTREEMESIVIEWIDNTGRSVDNMCKHFGVSNVKDLTESDLKTVLGWARK